jgi:hypothetical protein
VAQVKQWVRIDYVTGHAYPPVIGFDFRDFAILLTYDLLRAEGGFRVFYDEEYSKYRDRLKYECRYFSKLVREFVFRISPAIAEEIRTTFRVHIATPCKKLFALLESCAPRDILPKFFKDP